MTPEELEAIRREAEGDANAQGTRPGIKWWAEKAIMLLAHIDEQARVVAALGAERDKARALLTQMQCDRSFDANDTSYGYASVAAERDALRAELAATIERRDALAAELLEAREALAEVKDAFSEYQETEQRARRMYHNWQDWTDEEWGPIEQAERRLFAALAKGEPHG